MAADEKNEGEMTPKMLEDLQAAFREGAQVARHLTFALHDKYNNAPLMPILVGTLLLAWSIARSSGFEKGFFGGLAEAVAKVADDIQAGATPAEKEYAHAMARQHLEDHKAKGAKREPSNEELLERLQVMKSDGKVH